MVICPFEVTVAVAVGIGSPYTIKLYLTFSTFPYFCGYFLTFVHCSLHHCNSCRFSGNDESAAGARIIALMSVLTSEAVVLRTWPVHEADLIVSFFTRDYGRHAGRGQGGAQEPQTLWRGAGADDAGAGLVCRAAAAGAGAAGPAGDSALAAFGAGGSHAHGGTELLCRGAGRNRCPSATRRRRFSGCWSRCWSRPRPSQSETGSQLLSRGWRSPISRCG